MNVQETFIMEGYNMISMRYLGNDLVLLLGMVEDNRKDILEGKEPWLSSIFESNMEWCPAAASGNGLLWHTPQCMELRML